MTCTADFTSAGRSESNSVVEGAGEADEEVGSSLEVLESADTKVESLSAVKKLLETKILSESRTIGVTSVNDPRRVGVRYELAPRASVVYPSGEIGVVCDDVVDIGDCYWLLVLEVVGNDYGVAALVQLDSCQELGEVEELDGVAHGLRHHEHVDVEYDTSNLELADHVGQRLALARGHIAHVEGVSCELDHHGRAQQGILRNVLLQECVEVGCFPTLGCSNCPNAASPAAKATGKPSAPHCHSAPEREGVWIRRKPAQHPL